MIMIINIKLNLKVFGWSCRFMDCKKLFVVVTICVVCILFVVFVLVTKVICSSSVCVAKKHVFDITTQ